MLSEKQNSIGNYNWYLNRETLATYMLVAGP